LVKFDFLTLTPVENWFPRSCFRHNAPRLIKPLRVSKQYTVGAGFKPGEIGKVVSGGESGVKKSLECLWSHVLLFTLQTYFIKTKLGARKKYRMR